jgi:hypothetical protein
VADTGIFKTGHQVWQRANVMAAAGYLREVMTREPGNVRVKALYEGLLEVIEPTRRVLRQQRELAAASSTAIQERRHGERRAGRDRRQFAMGPPTGVERRSGTERRRAERRKR